MFSAYPYPSSHFHPFANQANSVFGYGPRNAYAQALAEEHARDWARAAAEDRARALAMERQRQRQSQYYPWSFNEPYEDDDDGYYYGPQFRYNPRNPAYIEAQRRQQAREHEAQRRQQAMEQLARRRREEEVARLVDAESRRRARVSASDADDGEEVHTVEIKSSSNREATPRPSSQTPSTAHQNDGPAEEVDFDDAASTIQSWWRIRKSLRTLSSLQNQFDELQTAFTWPNTLDFELASSGGSMISLSTSPSVVYPSNTLDTPAKLAYTKNNAPLHKYTESLSRLLVSLDGVESWGDKSVREKRKAIVRAVEAEAEAIEKRWRDLWNGASKTDKEKSLDLPDAMALDPPSDGTEICDELAADTMAQVTLPSEDSRTLVTECKLDSSAQDSSASGDLEGMDALPTSSATDTFTGADSETSQIAEAPFSLSMIDAPDEPCMEDVEVNRVAEELSNPPEIIVEDVTTNLKDTSENDDLNQSTAPSSVDDDFLKAEPVTELETQTAPTLEAGVPEADDELEVKLNVLRDNEEMVNDYVML